LISRYERFAAVNAFPDPVAIWIRARGLNDFSESSVLRVAVSWPVHRPFGSRGGRFSRRLRSVAWRRPRSGSPRASRVSASVSGRWNEKTLRLAGCGSRAFVNVVSTPVHSYANTATPGAAPSAICL
jgi:hypothetical protein